MILEFLTLWNLLAINDQREMRKILRMFIPRKYLRIYGMLSHYWEKHAIIPVSEILLSVCLTRSIEIVEVANGDIKPELTFRKLSLFSV